MSDELARLLAQYDGDPFAVSQPPPDGYRGYEPEQRNALAPADGGKLSARDRVLQQAMAMRENHMRADPYTLALGIGLMGRAPIGPVGLPRMPVAVRDVPAPPLRSAADGRWVSPVSGTWHDVPPEFGSKLWARDLATKIEYSPVWDHLGPAAVGSYLANKLYDPIADTGKAVVDWWNDPSAPVGPRRAGAYADKARVPYPPDPNKP